MSGFEVNLQQLDDGGMPGLRVEAGLEELRDILLTAYEHDAPTVLHFGRDDELQGVVSQVGAGVVLFEPFGVDDNERAVVPLDKVVWVRIKRPA